jgi:hypothetical protein
MFTGNSKEAKLARTGLAVGIFWVLGRRLGVFAHPGRWGMGILVVALLGSLLPNPHVSQTHFDLMDWSNTWRDANIVQCDMASEASGYSDANSYRYCRCMWYFVQDHLDDDARSNLMSAIADPRLVDGTSFDKKAIMKAYSSCEHYLR